MQRYIGTMLVVISLGLVILCAGCGGPKQVPAEVSKAGASASPVVAGQMTNVVVPDWFLNLPEDPNYMYAAGSASSTTMSMARKKAENDAHEGIANQLQLKVSGMFKRFREEVGAGEDAQMMEMSTAVSKEIYSETLSGLKPVKQEILQDGKLFTVYILMELSIGDMNSAAVDKVKANKDMYTRFRASQGFKELETEVEKYEEWKKNQGT